MNFNVHSCSECHKSFPIFSHPKKLTLNQTRYKFFIFGYGLYPDMKNYIFECSICRKKICTNCFRNSKYCIFGRKRKIAVICTNHETTCVNLYCKSKNFFPLHSCDFENCSEKLCPSCSVGSGSQIFCYRHLAICKCGKEFVKLDKIELKNHDTYFYCDVCLFEEREKLSLLNKSFPRDISEKIYQETK